MASQMKYFFLTGIKTELFKSKKSFMRKFSFLVFIAILGMTSCRFLGKRVHGNGVKKQRKGRIRLLRKWKPAGRSNYYVTQGDLKPVKIEGDENILRYIEVIQEGDRITIQTKQGVNFNPSGDLNVYVTSPAFKSIDVSGSSDIIGQNKITSTDELSLEASGAGDIKMEVDAPKIMAGISGSGSINLKGQAKDWILTFQVPVTHIATICWLKIQKLRSPGPAAQTCMQV